MEAEDFRNIATEIAKSLPEISTLFEINLGNPEILNEILERATEALVTASLQTVEHGRKIQLAACKLASDVHMTADKMTSDYEKLRKEIERGEWM